MKISTKAPCRVDLADALRAAKKYRLPQAAYVIRYFAPKEGFDLTTRSEAPAGAGISGSRTPIIALSPALNRLTGAGYPIEKIREIGGVSAIELTEAGIARKAIPVDLEEPNERVVPDYTGEPRNSGINNREVMKAHDMRLALERADWSEAARLLPGITTPLIDKLAAVTPKAGAPGARARGAGGGGGAKAPVPAAIGREGAEVLPVRVAARGGQLEAAR